MVLYLVGLGLGDHEDITVRGLKIVRRCLVVYLEHYTSILGIDVKRLEAFYEREIVLADRLMVESSADTIFAAAVDEEIALLVVGDPLCATTHTDIMLRAKEAGVEVQVVHNASVMGAVASCGLQLYQFGQTVSICFFDGTWRPDSFYDKVKYNQQGKMHTLCLLDIKVKEPDMEAMMRNQTVFLPPRFMTVNQAVEQLLEVEAKRKEGVCGPDAQAIGVARLGQPTQAIYAGTLEELRTVDFGGPLHSLVLCGELHELELEFLKTLQPPPPSATAATSSAAAAAADNESDDAEEEPAATAHAPPPPPSTTTSSGGLPTPPAANNDGGGGGGNNNNNDDDGAKRARDHQLDDEDLFELTGLGPGAMMGSAESDDDDDDGDEE